MRFNDFIAAELGTGLWVVAPRLTPRLRARGYDVAISPKRYLAVEAEWERRTYGAPLASLRAAAPDLLAALRLCADREDIMDDDLGDAIRAAIAKAEGKPCDA